MSVILIFWDACTYTYIHTLAHTEQWPSNFLRRVTFPPPSSPSPALCRCADKISIPLLPSIAGHDIRTSGTEAERKCMKDTKELERKADRKTLLRQWAKNPGRVVGKMKSSVWCTKKEFDEITTSRWSGLLRPPYAWWPCVAFNEQLKLPRRVAAKRSVCGQIRSNNKKYFQTMAGCMLDSLERKTNNLRESTAGQIPVQTTVFTLCKSAQCLYQWAGALTCMCACVSMVARRTARRE